MRRVAYRTRMTGHMPPQFIPQDIDMTAVKAQVAATGVSAPPTAMPGLLDVVNHARAEGINLKIVLLDHNPPIDTNLRDISTVVGADYPDATVLTLSPSFVGTYSTDFPRVTLEAGEDIAKTGNPVLSAQHFLNELGAPEFPVDRVDACSADRRACGSRRRPIPATTRKAASNVGFVR